MIRNKTKNNLLVRTKSFCNSPWSQARGLMFSKKKNDFGLVFSFENEKIISLHMWFVFYPIDVIFLDKNKRVVELKEDFKPFSFYFSKNKAMHFIELPSGIIKNKNISLKDEIIF